MNVALRIADSDVSSIHNPHSTIRNLYQAPDAVQSRGCKPRQAGNGATVAVLGCAAASPEPDQFFVTSGDSTCFSKQRARLGEPPIMSDSHVLARKFRPQTFDQVIGQDAITRTLSNAVKNDRVHHAYIFTGARGVGKTTTARIFAKALNCVKGVTPEPCGICDSCRDIVAS